MTRDPNCETAPGDTRARALGPSGPQVASLDAAWSQAVISFGLWEPLFIAGASHSQLGSCPAALTLVTS